MAFWALALPRDFRSAVGTTPGDMRSPFGLQEECQRHGNDKQQRPKEKPCNWIMPALFGDIRSNDSENDKQGSKQEYHSGMNWGINAYHRSTEIA